MGLRGIAQHMNKIFALFCLTLGYVMSPFSACYGASDTVTATVHQESDYQVSVAFNIPKGWHVYGPETLVGMPPLLMAQMQKNIQDVHATWPEETLFHQMGETFSGYDNNTSLKINFEPRHPHRGSRYVGKLDYAACKDICIPQSIDIRWVSQATSDHCFLWILALAFLGGLILNLMPCILPILSLKIFVISKGAAPEKRKKTPLFMHLLGSLLFFFLFSSIVYMIRHFGLSAGWGMHFQNPYFVAFFMWILMMGLLRLTGIYQTPSPSITLPVNLSPEASSFLDGLLLAILATPCTAPFLGYVSGLSLTMPYGDITLIFLCIWLGFNVPYWMLILAPKFTHSLMPKPGKWMKGFTYFMVMLLGMSLLWILWVLSVQVGQKVALMGGAVMLLSLLAAAKLPRGRVLFLLLSLGCISLPLLSLHSERVVNFNQAVDFRGYEERAQQGETIFVRVGAAWCLTCMANEPLIHSEKVQQLMGTQNVQQYYLDWTDRSLEIGQFLSEYDRDEGYCAHS